MSLQGIGTNSGLWILDREFLLGPGIEFGTRTTLVKLADGSVLVHAPAEMSEAEVAEIKALGRVSTLVAPNSFHHLFLEKAMTAFPDATLHAAPSVIAKYPQLVATALTETPAPAWDGVLEQVYVEGAPKLDEFVFFHPGSRTLLLVDLCFNVQKATRIRTRVMLTIMGAWGRLGPSRLARSMFKDRAGVRGSVDRILDWDFDRVVVTHGDIIETGGRERLREVFEWLKP
jgi:hypothetical protein